MIHVHGPCIDSKGLLCGVYQGEVFSVCGEQFGEDGLSFKPLLLVIHIAIHEPWGEEEDEVIVMSLLM